jgi:hypothetical protein
MGYYIIISFNENKIINLHAQIVPDQRKTPKPNDKKQ